jgi:light-regulated signal transduction histidine kinase (bacteriophytochrome)
LLATVNWAGNPDKSVSADAEGKSHPRSSFRAWQQTVRGQARPWTKPQLATAAFSGLRIVNFRNVQRIREIEAQEDPASS